MSILKTNWQTGDVVTAEKLNAMQYAVVPLTYNQQSGTTRMEVTAKELHEALMSGVIVFGVESDSGDWGGYINYTLIGRSDCAPDDGGYQFVAFRLQDSDQKPVVAESFYALNDTDYPETPVS